MELVRTGRNFFVQKTGRRGVVGKVLGEELRGGCSTAFLRRKFRKGCCGNHEETEGRVLASVEI